MRFAAWACLSLLILTPYRAPADEVSIPGLDGIPLGSVPVENTFLDRVEAALAPDGSAAAISVRHGRHGGASLYLLDSGQPPQTLLETDPEQTLSDPIWSPDGLRLAVVLRGPARRLPGENFLRQGGEPWVCARDGDCAQVGWADDLWRAVAFDNAQSLIVARALPGDLVRLAPARLDLTSGAVLTLTGFIDLPLDSPEPFPAPPSAPAPLRIPADQSLAMPYIHQVYDTPNEFNGHWACGPTSTLMAIQHYGRLDAWPVTVDVPYSHNSDYGAYVSKTYSAYGSTFDRAQNDASGHPATGAYGWCTEDGMAWAWRMQDYARRHDLSSDFDGSSTFAEVQAALEQDKVVPISTRLTSAGHIVTAKGYTSDGRLITNDPYGDKNQGYMNYAGENAIYTWTQVNSSWFITVYGSGALETDDSAFVSQSILDGTHFLPGEPFDMRWTLKNTGTSTWTRADDYLFTHDGDERYSAPEQTLLPAEAAVRPGETWDWNLPMVAPTSPGAYRGYFRMDRYGTHRFGTRVFLDIVVDDWPDEDGDGHRADTDCDDSDPDVYPGAEEICDGIDNDCDGETDEGVLNLCGTCGPEPDEICGDGIDNDCDGETDEGCEQETDGGSDGGADGDNSDPGGDSERLISGGCACGAKGNPGSLLAWLILGCCRLASKTRGRRP